MKANGEAFLWKVSLKILNSGFILKTCDHVHDVKKNPLYMKETLELNLI